MRVLIFQAATSAAAIAAMTRLSDEVRAAGHTGGLRSLPHFRREKEPADRILVALSPQQADRFKNLGAELVATFQDTDRIIPVQLPDEEGKDAEAELRDFDFKGVVSDLEGEGKGNMTMDQLRAEAIERAIEIRADSTREELEHALDIDQHPGAQAGDRITDRQNMETDPATRDRIGLRTSTVLPNVNGLDLERMNDDQLASTAAQIGLKVPKNANRTTLINKITDTFAEKVQAPEGSAPQAPAENFETDLVTLDAPALEEIAKREEVDVGRTTSADGIRAKIVEARKAKADGGSNG